MASYFRTASRRVRRILAALPLLLYFLLMSLIAAITLAFGAGLF